MAMRGTKGPQANALKREMEFRVEATSHASVGSVYDLLADLRSHLTWAGERQRGKARLLTVEAPDGPASVGTEFFTTGSDPMGRFTDRSVVTEATRHSVFEFVTEARLITRRGDVADWTTIHRYDLTPTSGGCRITYTIRVTRISSLPGMLGLFNVGPLAGLVRRTSERVARRSTQNLASLAEGRAGV
jgi:hypothetical protein